jgi:hypothetical protein
MYYYPGYTDILVDNAPAVTCTVPELREYGGYIDARKFHLSNRIFKPYIKKVFTVVVPVASRKGSDVSHLKYR